MLYFEVGEKVWDVETRLPGTMHRVVCLYKYDDPKVGKDVIHRHRFFDEEAFDEGWETVIKLRSFTEEDKRKQGILSDILEEIEEEENDD